MAVMIKLAGGFGGEFKTSSSVVALSCWFVVVPVAMHLNVVSYIAVSVMLIF